MTQKQKERLAALLPDSEPRWVRIYDNEGETAERYTCVFTGRYTHKTGGQHWVVEMSAQGEGTTDVYDHLIDAPNGKRAPVIGRKCYLGRRFSFDDLPEKCKQLVMFRYCYLWNVPNIRGDIYVCEHPRKSGYIVYDADSYWVAEGETETEAIDNWNKYNCIEVSFGRSELCSGRSVRES